VKDTLDIFTWFVPVMGGGVGDKIRIYKKDGDIAKCFIFKVELILTVSLKLLSSCVPSL